MRAKVGSRARRVGSVLALGLVLVGAPWLRVVVDGRADLAEAESLERAGKIWPAVEAYGRAARWWAPLAGHDERALERLEVHAREAEMLRDFELALLAQRERRRALLGTRTPWGVRDAEALRDANEAIVRLQGIGRGPELVEEGASESGANADAPMLARYDALPPGPTGSTYASALAFLLWAVAGVVFVVRSFGPRGQLQRGPAVRWGALWLISTLAWWLSL